MLAIHKSNFGFHNHWVKYCEENNIPFRRVDCYATNIIDQLHDCDGLMWHHSQMNPRDLIIAKVILSALEHSGFCVFPDWRTGWHFDDKVAQKYLFEAIGAPIVPTWVFVDKLNALDWVNSVSFPKVLKLRGGAGSSNVRLVRNRQEARRLVRRAFGSGFPNYDVWGSLKERWRKFRLGKEGVFEVLKGFVRIFSKPPFAKLLGNENGYIYFQEFIPNNDSDIRIIVIDEKAFALKRYVRKGDFRASGSGHFAYDRDHFDERCVRLVFELTEQIGSQCAAYDFVFDANSNPLLVEVSYGFVKEGYDSCPGFWDRNINWHDGTFNPPGWMVESFVQKINSFHKRRKEL